MTREPKCEECRGACCESFCLPAKAVPTDAQRWLALHGTLVEGGTRVEFEARCTKLTAGGRCSIYETRPVTCAIYAVGGEACLETIRRRRPEYAKELGLDEKDTP